MAKIHLPWGRVLDTDTQPPPDPDPEAEPWVAEAAEILVGALEALGVSGDTLADLRKKAADADLRKKVTKRAPKGRKE